MNHTGILLNTYLDSQFKTFEEFKTATNGVIYSENCDGQLKMIFIDTLKELDRYLGDTVIHTETGSNGLHIILEG